MTDSQYHGLMMLLSLQFGLNIGCYTALLFIIRNTGRKQ